MSKEDNRGLESLIRGAESLIHDIPAPRSPGEDLDPMEVLINEAAKIQAGQPLSDLVEPFADGSVQITVSSDELIVLGTFFPPGGSGKPLELGAVQAAIDTLGITTGIDWEAIRACIQTCNEERSRVSDAVIARGLKPINEVLPFLVITESLKPKEKVEDIEAARIDFREISPFILVKKGDVLATLVPKQNGAMGTTVRGAAVAFQKESVAHPKPGRNTEWRQDVVLAACDGRLQLNVGNFWVDEILDIRGSIDYHVGNVNFKGDVVIQGEIRDGFHVKAGGSVLCLGSIEACQIECAGDLVTRQGIMGKQKAVLFVGGTIQAKFVEGCALDCGGAIFVRTSVLNSSVHTRDRLDTGERGIIIGGKIHAQNGVSAAQIGTERGPKTEIHCGIDFKIEQRLIWIRDKNIALAFKLREIENRMKISASTRNVLSPLRDKIKTAIHRLNENARSLVSNLDRNEEASVAVREIVFPGTYIEICHVSFFVTCPRRSVTFRLDKASGKIMESKYERQPAVKQKS